MLYSKKELEKRLQSGCALYYFYASDEALVHAAAQKALAYLNRDDPETTVLDGPTPSVEEIVLAAGTISFFGGKRLVLMPLIRPSTYSDKDLQELCDTLADTENAIFVMTGVVEEAYGKLRPGKREQKLIGCCIACRSTAPQGRRCRLWPAIGQSRPVLPLHRGRRPPCWCAAVRINSF